MLPQKGNPTEMGNIVKLIIVTILYILALRFFGA
jgi:hypothetical protein